MEMKGHHGFGNSSTCNGDIQRTVGDKSMQYSFDQVVVLEQFFVECPEPSQAMRLAMIHQNSVLSNLDSQQIQAWFENRRFLEKKKKEAFVFNFLNEKMAATGRLLLLENEYLHGEVQLLLRRNDYLRKLLQYASLESFLAPEVPRSIYKNVKIVAARRLLLLQNENLYNEVQQLRRTNNYIQNLLENISATTSSNSVKYYQYSSEVADSSKGLLMLSGTMPKFPPKTSSVPDWVSIPSIKFSGGVKEIFVNICSDLTCFPVHDIIMDGSVILSFVKAAMLPDGPLDLLLRKNQEFIVSCSIKDIKLDQISFKDKEELPTTTIVHAFPPLVSISQEGEEPLNAVVRAFLSQSFGVVVGRYSVLGACRYFPNEQAASGDVKFILCFKFTN